MTAGGDATAIVSTFDEPEHLCMVLLALARQTVPPAEAIVADDGSADATARTLGEIAPSLPFRLVHVRQPHEDFRLARSRNNAIHLAAHERLLFLDQDTLPHRNWVGSFLSRLRPGRVCTGYVLRLGEEASARLTGENVRLGEFEKWHGRAEFSRLDRLQRKNLFYVACRRLGLGIKGRPAIAFGNAAACKSDLVRVNGFDEEYIGWGQEDDDLGWRLYKSGVSPVALINRALVTHIHHPPRHADWKNGANIRRYRGRRVSFRCGKGLDAHPHPDVTVVSHEMAGQC